jgi:hypothetical protein
MLGDDLVDSGDGYFITRKNSSYQIISYNYIHYGDLFPPENYLILQNPEILCL